MQYNETYNNYNEIIDANPILSRDEELALVNIIKEFKSGKQKAAAREKLINSNIRLVLKEACYYSRNSGVPQEDLFMAGIEGLCIAIDRFNPGKYGTKLSTYANHWIKLMIYRLMSDYSSNVHVPNHIIEQARNYRKNYKDIESTLTNKELMKELDVTERGLRNIRMAQARVTSLNAPLYVDDSGHEQTIEDLIADTKTPDPADMLLQKDLRRRLAKELSRLDPEAIDILTRRYLLDKKEDLNHIGKQLKITGERVRQIEYKALKLLRRRIKSRLSFGV